MDHSTALTTEIGREGFSNGSKRVVAETLAEIVNGVKEAQARTQDSGAIVSPQLRVNPDLVKFGVFSASSYPAQMVEFDVAVTAMEGTGTKGGIGVVTGIYQLEARDSRKRKIHP